MTRADLQAAIADYEEAAKAYLAVVDSPHIGLDSLEVHDARHKRDTCAAHLAYCVRAYLREHPESP